MRPLRIYVDTSVIGGCFDAPFAEASRKLIEMARRGDVVLVLSDLPALELERAPPAVQAILGSLGTGALEDVRADEEAERLRTAYLEAGILGPASQDDALHVAIATVAEADMIVSWNFKHIVHYDKIRQFNGVNLVRGYRTIQVHTPLEVIK